MATNFGKLLRKIRIDMEINLKQMAEGLGVSSAYLSGIEVGSKKLTNQFTDRVVDWVMGNCQGTEEDKKELRNQLYAAAAQSVKEVKLNDMPEDDMELALAFARKFREGTLDKTQLKRLLDEEI